MDAIRLASAMFGDDTRSFPVRLWDGTVLPPPRPAGVEGTVVLTRRSALAAFLPPASELALARAFVAGIIEIEGNTLDVLEATALWRGPRAPRAELLTWILAAARHALPDRALGIAADLKGRTHSMGRDARAVRYHYDVSNALYRLFLDPTLTYSCGYFPTGRETLEQAQRGKLDLICRKLALRRQDRLLDVGCGWGGLLVHAAERYGARGLGITLSQNQLSEARERLLSAEGGEHFETRLADYRTLDDAPAFDKVASVGMMEHVGREQLETYFHKIHRVLRPGGLFLNHAIASLPRPEPTLPWTSEHRGGFIQRYIFPDTDLVPIARVIATAEKVGFEVRDLESLREHYVETLSVWLTRLEKQFPQAVSLVGVERARAFRLYLASSALAFRTGRISVFQLLLAKQTSEGRAVDVPRARARWYEAPVQEPLAPGDVYQRGA